MYIDFELTDTDMVFTLRQEDGTTIRTDTYPLETHTSDPNDKLNPTSVIVRLISEPKGTWPPQASYPLCRIVFINSIAGPYQALNEGGV